MIFRQVSQSDQILSVPNNEMTSLESDVRIDKNAMNHIWLTYALNKPIDSTTELLTAYRRRQNVLIPENIDEDVIRDSNLENIAPGKRSDKKFHRKSSRAGPTKIAFSLPSNCFHTGSPQYTLTPANDFKLCLNLCAVFVLYESAPIHATPRIAQHEKCEPNQWKRPKIFSIQTAYVHLMPALRILNHKKTSCKADENNVYLPFLRST